MTEPLLTNITSATDRALHPEQHNEVNRRVIAIEEDILDGVRPAEGTFIPAGLPGGTIETMPNGYGDSADQQTLMVPDSGPAIALAMEGDQVARLLLSPDPAYGIVLNHSSEVSGWVETSPYGQIYLGLDGELRLFSTGKIRLEADDFVYVQGGGIRLNGDLTFEGGPGDGDPYSVLLVSADETPHRILVTDDGVLHTDTAGPPTAAAGPTYLSTFKWGVD